MHGHSRFSEEKPSGPWIVSWMDVVCAWILAAIIVLLTLLA